jgi:hypothetical protein
MLRIEALEDSLPKTWRRAVRDHPWIAVSVAASAGFYLGRNHGRQMLSALVSASLSVGVESVRRAIGVPASGGGR